MNEIKDTLDFIIKSIVPQKTKVSIEEKQEEGIIVFEISAPTEVIGRIIGKEGKIIKSIRNILNLAFPQTRFLLKIKE
ncbi:MAG: KH domain-containing protein [Candidatus Shapirobacteria bacterium]|nr:KH domain-containing protein [Candidatus Shapirobacteria bacterium]